MAALMLLASLEVFDVGQTAKPSRRASSRRAAMSALQSVGF